MSIWILVANASKARLYVTEHAYNPQLHNAKTFSHPESRKKITELFSDRQGHFQGNFGSGDFKESDHKAVEAEKFARELATTLKAGGTSHRDDELIVIAPPHFYGLLKQQLNSNFGKIKSIRKDYTKLTEKELARHMQGHLWG